MPAFDALANLIQTIHDPPHTFVLLSQVSNYSWQIKLFFIASQLKCYVSHKREEISRDRKLVAGDKEAAFKDWKTLADFISTKIIAGDLHVAGWGTDNVQVIIDPGRPSSLTVPLTPLAEGDAAATVTDLVYLVANDARENRRCVLIPPPLPSVPVKQPEVSPASTTRSVKSTKINQDDSQEKAEQAELARLKAELAAKEDELARERAKPKAESARTVAAPPKAVAGASTAMPGHVRRVIKRAEFSDEEDDDEAPSRAKPVTVSASKAAGKKPESATASQPNSRKPPPTQARRVIKRAEFDDDDDGDDGIYDEAVPAHSKAKPSSRGTGQSSNSASKHPSNSRAKPQPTGSAKRVIKRAEFDDDDDDDDDADAEPAGKKRRR